MVSILEIILGRDVVLRQLPQAEKEIRRTVWSKIVRMDVLTADVEDGFYEVEVQKKNTGNLPRRSRAYNGYIDSKLLPPGNLDYNTLNDVYIIIVMPFDLFGKGKYQYTFQMMCEEVEGLKLGDGATRIFLNTRGADPDGVSEELIELLHYFERSTEETACQSNSERIRKIHDHVRRIKENEEVGIRFMNAWEERLLDRQEAYDEGHLDGHADGHAKGLSEGILRVAKNLKSSGMPIVEISENTGLSPETIEKI